MFILSLYSSFLSIYLANVFIYWIYSSFQYVCLFNSFIFSTFLSFIYIHLFHIFIFHNYIHVLILFIFLLYSSFLFIFSIYSSFSYIYLFRIIFVFKFYSSFSYILFFIYLFNLFIFQIIFLFFIRCLFVRLFKMARDGARIYATPEPLICATLCDSYSCIYSASGLFVFQICSSLKYIRLLQNIFIFSNGQEMALLPALGTDGSRV